MSCHWYLVASLPYLRFGEKPAMNADAFRAACEGQLSPEEMSLVIAVLDRREPPADSVAAQWWNGEVQIRNTLVQLRVKKSPAEISGTLRPFDGFSVTIQKLTTDAFARSNPSELEQEIDRLRWALADELALTEPFGFAAVIAYAVKVKIAERWAQMNDEKGLAVVEELIEKVTALENEQEAES